MTRGYGTLSIVPAVILQGMCIFAYASLLVYCAHQTFSFLFRCSAKESDCVERDRIQTYPKEEECLFSCMQRLRDKMKMLDRAENTLNRQGEITQEEQDLLDDPNPARLPTNKYTNSSVWFFSWLFGKK